MDPAGLADELGVGSHVTVASFVDDSRLRALYAEASAFAFLSEYEGFGLTPLEALAAGVPPIVLDTAVAREVYGAAATYVAAPDPGLVSDAVVAMLTDQRSAASGARRRASRARASIDWERRRTGDARCDRGCGPVTVTIVIVAFNAREDLERCLVSLRQRPATFDARSDRRRQRVDRRRTGYGTDGRFQTCGFSRHPRNVGFSAGNNLAIRESRSELLLLLNPDTVVPPGAVDALIAALRAHPEAAAIGPRLADAEERAELSFGPMPSPWGEAWQRFLGEAHRRHVWPIHGWVESMTRQDRTVAWVSGACLLVRRADAVAVGLLDERFFLYWEDVDFCAALRATGRTVRFTAAATVTHLRGRSAVGRRPAVTAAYRRGQLAFYRKWKPRWARLLASYLRWRGQDPEKSPLE